MIGFRELLDIVFSTSLAKEDDNVCYASCATIKKNSLIFIGPKLEPFVENNHNARKAYGKLSKAIKRVCNSHHYGNE